MTSIRDKSSSSRINRRQFVKSTAASAALVGAVQSQFPFGAHVAQAAGPEVKPPGSASSR